jgi:hypothetical protein
MTYSSLIYTPLRIFIRSEDNSALNTQRRVQRLLAPRVNKRGLCLPKPLQQSCQEWLSLDGIITKPRQLAMVITSKIISLSES